MIEKSKVAVIEKEVRKEMLLYNPEMVALKSEDERRIANRTNMKEIRRILHESVRVTRSSTSKPRS